MTSIKGSETAQKSALQIQDKFSSRQNAVQDKIQCENFFSDDQNFFFQTEFCLGLYLSQTELCLGLNLSQITYRSCILYTIF